MSRFVDVRHSHQPAGSAGWRPLAKSTQELEDLFRLCRSGRLYEVEAWIADGRPLQVLPSAAPKTWRRRTSLKIALETGQHSLCSLLLSSGYRLDLEPNSPFDTALKSRHWDLVDLLFACGADPLQADVYNILYTYHVPIYERFMAAGYDLTTRHEMASMLSGSKPLLGFVRRHRHDRPEFQRELDMALAYHSDEDDERGVSLCLWAGANPHKRVPSLRWPDLMDEEDESEPHYDGYSAIENAVSSGHTKILKRLGPDPTKDDFDELYRDASDGYTVDVLAAISPPTNVAEIIVHRSVYWNARYRPFSKGSPVSAVEHVFKAGARWATGTPQEISAVRSGILGAKDSDFVELMKILCEGDRCSPEVLKELARSPSMRKRLRAVGLIPRPGDEENHRRTYYFRPTGGQMVAKKCDIPWPKPKPFVPKVLTVGRWRPAGKSMELTRQQLYEKVWSEPVDKLAHSWGLSGRGLGKVCERLKVPVPPRGYWARIEAGYKVKRSTLRPDRPGIPESIELWLPAPPESPSQRK